VVLSSRIERVRRARYSGQKAAAPRHSGVQHVRVDGLTADETFGVDPDGLAFWREGAGERHGVRGALARDENTPIPVSSQIAAGSPARFPTQLRLNSAVLVQSSSTIALPAVAAALSAAMARYREAKPNSLVIDPEISMPTFLGQPTADLTVAVDGPWSSVDFER
jgi:hypothetical protein